MIQYMMIQWAFFNSDILTRHCRKSTGVNKNINDSLAMLHAHDVGGMEGAVEKSHQINSLNWPLLCVMYM